MRRPGSSRRHVNWATLIPPCWRSARRVGVGSVSATTLDDQGRDLNLSGEERRVRAFIYGSGITPEEAKDLRWHLDWKAVPTDREDLGGCAGVSSKNWKHYEEDFIYIDVGTSE